MSTLQGNAAEDKACKYLMEQGLTLRCRNYRTRRGELDIVMQDGSTIVCVEIKYRRRNQFGSALEFVTAKKLQRIQAAFDFYLLDNGLNPASTSLRIDVVAIDGDNLQWLKNVG
ncbi:MULTISPECIES: YraN family protein [Alteromonas]|uniref:YraN family protein n=1 Tax=Alteromonas TaxID=226 RepID=UPI001279E422|nr:MULTISPECIES: YraN family protein [Alteromonas]CAI2391133.1 putative endonuclease [Alteromonas macleodii]CAI3965094.1 putative endonuclease [Alteromonas macleodii]CAI3965475.1 putative endonuclease [Alteromonas macleodii]CAI3965477.1 putative endonuclease [Alteromonas macleodii]VTO40730.1 putative endonuclease [Alteromonas macleodii]